jgi:iron complex outermembrane receptor protein
MAFQQRKIAAGIAYALGVTAALGAFPAAAQDVRIEVTGTNIRRVDVETVSPVSIITREEITRTGMPTVAEVLRSLPANSGSYGESFTNSFAPGASAISLRGLGQKATLVLLNGRRVSGYGFAQNISDTFVDLNAIPSSAVERIEILNDGASAIYGSDALAGVVNVILRTNYTGLEGTGSVGWFEGKNDYRATLTGGTGNLAKDKYNVFGTLDYYKRDLVLMSDTDFGSSRDYRGEGGGRNQGSITTGGTWRQLTATGGLTNNYRAIADCAANGSTVMTGPEAVAAGLINVTPPTPGVPGGQSAAAYATSLAMAAATNTFCTRDINSGLTALPETERIGFLGRGTYQFSPDVQFYLEGAYSHNESFQVFTAPFYGTTALQQTPAGLRPFTYNINFAPGVAGNPYSSNARFLGSFWDRGTRDAEITSDTFRVLAGAKYLVAGWDLDSAVGWSKNEVDANYTNRLSLSGTSAVFGVPTSPQPPVPLSTSSAYNLNQPSLTPQSVYERMRIDVTRKAESELFFVDTRATTEIQSWKLPGGPVGVAVGAEYRDESLKDTPDALAQAGEVLGQGITATDGSRQSYAAYAELALPITKQLEAQLALRYDHYSDYGSSTTPKVGVKWVPIKELLFRANWGKGFRAPTLPEISKSIATSFQLVIDPEDQQQRQVSAVSSGNEELKAEKSESAVIGFVLEPTTNTSFGMNYYWIDWKDRILRPSSQDVLNASCPNGGPGCPSIPGVVLRDPSNANQVVTVFRSYENQASVKTTGVDFDARIRIPTDSYGRFVVRVNGAYLDRFEEDGVDYAGANDGSYTQPRVRGLFALDWDYGPWSATGRINYIHSYRQELLPASYRAVQNPEFQTGTYPNRVPSYTTVDLFGSYRINKNWSVSAAVLNVGDELPQYDPGFTTTELYDWSTFDIRGRQFRLSFTYAM